MSFLTSKPQDQETRGLKKELNKKIEQYPQVQRIYINIIRSIHSSFNVHILHIYIYVYIQMHVKYTQISANSEIQWDFGCHPKNPRDGRPGIPMAAAGGGPKISSTS